MVTILPAYPQAGGLWIRVSGLGFGNSDVWLWSKGVGWWCWYGDEDGWWQWCAAFDIKMVNHLLMFRPVPAWFSVENLRVVLSIPFERHTIYIQSRLCKPGESTPLRFREGADGSWQRWDSQSPQWTPAERPFPPIADVW